eukprot:362082-Chlamydomonas_euryale.AAC.7
MCSRPQLHLERLANVRKKGVFEFLVPHDTAVPILIASTHKPLGFGSLPREALAATGYRHVLGGIDDDADAEKLRLLR